MYWQMLKQLSFSCYINTQIVSMDHFINFNRLGKPHGPTIEQSIILMTDTLSLAEKITCKQSIRPYIYIYNFTVFPAFILCFLFINIVTIFPTCIFPPHFPQHCISLQFLVSSLHISKSQAD